MHIRFGYAIDLDCPQETPVILRLDVHPDQCCDLTRPVAFSARDAFSGRELEAEAPFLDSFGTVCRRLMAPQGRLHIEARGEIYHSGFADPRREGARQIAPEALPVEVLPYLTGSRYCECDLLAPFALSRFGALENGWDRVVAITDFVHNHLRFDRQQAGCNHTAMEVFDERVGVCRDFTHLAITLCRALTIPARYCTGFLGDIGVANGACAGDFASWFEVYLDDAWWVFDARHNTPRIGRILVARGLDAADVPIISPFGNHVISRLDVITQEVRGQRFPVSSAERRDRFQIIEGGTPDKASERS